MIKFKIEISKPQQIFIWFGIADLIAIASFSMVISILSKNIPHFLISIMLMGFVWLLLQIFLLNITITDKDLNLNVANHKSFSIPISSITSVRYKNENDYIVRGNPVYSKNVIAVEYLNEKGEKNTWYFSVSNLDSENIIQLLVKRGCSFKAG